MKTRHQIRPLYVFSQICLAIAVSFLISCMHVGVVNFVGNQMKVCGNGYATINDMIYEAKAKGCISPRIASRSPNESGRFGYDTEPCCSSSYFSSFSSDFSSQFPRHEFQPIDPERVKVPDYPPYPHFNSQVIDNSLYKPHTFEMPVQPQSDRSPAPSAWIFYSDKCITFICANTSSKSRK